MVVDALAGAGGGGPQETQNWNACWESKAFLWAGVGVQLGGTSCLSVPHFLYIPGLGQGTGSVPLLPS